MDLKKIVLFSSITLLTSSCIDMSKNSAIPESLQDESSPYALSLLCSARSTSGCALYSDYASCLADAASSGCPSQSFVSDSGSPFTCYQRPIVPGGCGNTLPGSSTGGQATPPPPPTPAPCSGTPVLAIDDGINQRDLKSHFKGAPIYFRSLRLRNTDSGTCQAIIDSITVTAPDPDLDLNTVGCNLFALLPQGAIPAAHSNQVTECGLRAISNNQIAGTHHSTFEVTWHSSAPNSPQVTDSFDLRSKINEVPNPSVTNLTWSFNSAVTGNLAGNRSECYNPITSVSHSEYFGALGFLNPATNPDSITITFTSDPAQLTSQRSYLYYPFSVGGAVTVNNASEPNLIYMGARLGSNYLLSSFSSAPVPAIPGSLLNLYFYQSYPNNINATSGSASGSATFKFSLPTQPTDDPYEPPTSTIQLQGSCL